MAISLCLIVGNVEDYIERCLQSFLPIADEVCLVRAIGNQKPDRTLEMALDVCDQANVPLRFAEYQNAPEHAAWPHVDNFAAARQRSFDLATGEYCFWCDSDDILLRGAERVRQLAREGGYAAFLFPYDIFGKNSIVDRERMMLKESGRWKYPVHECFTFTVEPVTAVVDDGVVIQHLPRLDKGDRELAKGGVTGNQRNLRILESIPAAELTPGLKYHLFGELLCAGRQPEAIDLAIKLLTETELGKDERYDLLIGLTLQTTDLDQRRQLLHEAHRTDPERREALGVLATTAIDQGQSASALAYARQMIATAEPAVHSWNSRRSFYGYVGDEIYQEALRANGRFAEAEKVRLDSLKRHGGPRIALLHATRGRPDRAAKCRKAWHDLASQPGRVEHIFAIDTDDRESDALRRFHHVRVPAGGGCVAAWNAAARLTAAPVLVQLSDDWIPCAHWDDLILDRLGDVNQPRVLAISDGSRRDDLLCMAIITRAYLCHDFFLFHPWFTGVYSDNWFTEVAYRRQAVIEARDIEFTHLHPAFGKAEMDETYRRQNAPERYAEGEAVLKELRAGNDWSSVPGFCNYLEFYATVAQTLKPGDTAVEVGCWLGRSIIFLAQTLKRLGKTGIKLVVVDTFKGETNAVEHAATVRQCGGSIRAAFEANLKRCGVADQVTIIEGDSAASAAQLPDGLLAFCFIDAAHDYESVKRDILAWKGKLKPGGLLAGHDIVWPDVARAVNEVLPAAKPFPPVWAVHV